jgi:3-dehydroquinate dehydratase type I
MKTSRAKICVPICAQHTGELAAGIAKAAEVADIVELRLDCLADDELEVAIKSLPGFFKSSVTATILTMRSPEQGGRTSADYRVRRRFWSSLDQTPRSSWLDLELDLVLDFAASELRAGLDWGRVICSHHNFAGPPGDLDKIYERLSGTPARILKIAVQANDATDCLQIFHLLKRAQRDGREMISIAMGHAGIMTRILGPSRGSFLTYGSLDDESATAPGQLTARELREVFRIDQIDQRNIWDYWEPCWTLVISSHSQRRLCGFPD